ncbi:MAG: hypothetical protein GWO20_03375 [Candidatus Korarchaeota archaeon]|nr:hypothetical protein [Candidatus Korarchaeota archaeon]NIU81915.1 hypothetical protein [Candidatus Thorarchaeota archaeon]NIW12373.1 hypothetical protein [Candidatus Thorarchaeota archaeon]NIW51165.1 hypothetical protein [Candidatus Korarchaeota archaeon]
MLLTDEQIIRVTKKTAQSLSIPFKYWKSDKNIKYVAEYDALVGNPLHPLAYLVKKANDVGITLSSQEQFKAVHIKTWHECMHGVIYRKLGEPSPFRYIPEDYWLYDKEAKRFGRTQYQGLTVNLSIDCKLVTPTLLSSASKYGEIDESTASSVALVLFCQEVGSLEEVSRYWADIQNLCDSVTSLKRLPKAAQDVQELLESHGVKGV